MKKFCLILLASLVLASSAFATPTCGPALMSIYDGASFSCVINSLLFSGFHYAGTAVGSTAIPDTSVMVTPILTPGDEGLRFSAPWFVSSANGDAREDSLINYTVTAPGILDIEVGFAGEAVRGTGNASVIEKYCIGETSALPCTSGGTPGSIAVSDPPAGFTSVFFFHPAASTLGLSKDIMLDSGTGANSFAEISEVTNTFSTPEPLTLVLLGSGLLGFGLLRKRIKR